MKKVLLFLLLSLLMYNSIAQDAIKIGVIGLTHTHVHWIFNSEKRGDFKIAGIVETDRALAQRYADQYDFSMDKIYGTMEELVKVEKLDAVTAFGTIYAHLSVVQFFAPRGIHVMVEKPLAVSMEHALEMNRLAEKHGIHLLTNYETTWYPTNHWAYELLRVDSVIGPIRKVIIRDGHKGPKRIGVNEEFLNWLTDPKLNGGGAIVDFGCYGANLMTWLMDGKKPISVTAITQQLQKENNPRVDDEAIVILDYGTSNAIVQASWNWPIGRKDMEIYGTDGVIYSHNRNDLRVRISEGYDGFDEDVFKLEEREAPYDDPFSYFVAVIKGEINVSSSDLSSLENNMIVMEILDAAKRSAEEKRTIILE